jgi:hypothetical protein
MGPFVIIAVAVVAAVVIWKVASGGLGDAKYVIKVSAEGIDGVSIKGEVPGKSQTDVAEFVAGLELTAGAKIWAVPDRDRLVLRFSNVPENLQQRCRNFFYN